MMVILTRSVCPEFSPWKIVSLAMQRAPLRGRVHLFSEERNLHASDASNRNPSL